MNELFKTELFGLMNENSQKITTEQMQHAYEKFIAQIDTISNVGSDLTSIIRKLNITRIELVYLLKQIQYEQGENALKLDYLQKALALINSELELLNLKMS